jgi:hypothetical protein
MSKDNKYRFNPSIFDKHVIQWVINTPDIQQLIFGEKHKDGKWNFNGLMKITLFQNTLAITRDYGDAVYVWGSEVSFEFIAGCNLHYFMGKCEASEVGREFKEWSSETAESTVKEYVYQAAGEWMESGMDTKDLLLEEHEEIEFEKLPDSFKEQYLQRYLQHKDLQYEYQCLIGACSDEFGFFEYLRANDKAVNSMIGGEWWECFGSNSMKVPHIRCEIHFAAMKKIWELIQKDRSQADIANNYDHEKDVFENLRNDKSHEYNSTK